MDPLSCDNAIYEDVKADSSHEGLDMHENNCYGKVTYQSEIDYGKKNSSCSKVIVIVFVLVFALLLGTAGACVAFALQITTLKSEIVSLRMASSCQNNFTDTLEEVVHTSINMLYHQLNTSIDTVHQQLSQTNQQLRQEYAALDGRTQQLNTSTQLLLNDLVGLLGYFPIYPTASCAALSPSSPSGYYWVRASNGSSVSVYCDMTRSCGGVTGGWTRVAELDMTNSSHQCPSGLMERNDSPNIRTCVRNEESGGCSSVELPTANIQYSSVCGRITAYQVGTPNQFTLQPILGERPTDINSAYVDGVSLTHGSPRQHIWTFAAARDEDQTCVCNGTEGTSPPAFGPRLFL